MMQFNNIIQNIHVSEAIMIFLNILYMNLIKENKFMAIISFFVEL